MHYEFPTINHIDDVLPHIAGSKEFIVAEREGYKVVNYIVTTPDTFPASYRLSGKLTRDYKDYKEFDHSAIVRRECRGMIFDQDGYILSRRLHKFFNVGEKSEVFPDKLDLSRPHRILEKLDGSMITPLVLNGGDVVRWATKMGVTEVAMKAEEFVAAHPQYVQLALLMFQNDTTPIFEFCSRKQRIVIDYPEDRLVLLAIRNNVTGTYWSYVALQQIAEDYNIEVVKAMDTHENIESLVDFIRANEDSEGVIIRFDDGHMVKVKSDWYVQIHKAKDRLTQEKDVIVMVLDNMLDDLKPHLLEEDLKKLSTFETDFWMSISVAHAYMVAELDRLYETYPTPKDMGLAIKEGKENLDPFVKSTVFKFFDNPTEAFVYEKLLEYIRKHTSSSTKVDEVRYLFGNARWSLY